MKRFLLFVFIALLFLLLVPGGGAAADTSALTLSSITPTSGETNTTVDIKAINGTNFASSVAFRLKRSSYNDILGYVKTKSSNQITGTLYLTNQAPGDYQVCVYNDASTFVCGLTFTVTSPGETAATSSIFFETYPEGAAVLLNGARIGSGVFTYNNVKPGTYKVLVQKSRYEDYAGSITVLQGKRARFYAQLNPVDTGAAVTATPVPTATTIRKSTLKVPTSWPGITPTTASPVDPVVIAVALGIALGFVMIRRR
jgi:hypothetical protein